VTERNSKNGNGEPLWGKFLRGVTPAGVIAIVVLVSGIQSDIHNNCLATKEIGRNQSIIIQVDNDLTPREKKTLRVSNVKCG
jgi:hypothetical protein